MPFPAAILFDFDGVIVHSEPLHLQAFQETVAAERIHLTDAEYYEELIGFDDRGAFKHLFAKHERPLDPPTLLRLMAHKSEIVRDLIDRRQFHALPGVEEFVRGLWRNYPLAICSGALREEIEAMLEGIALRDCFSVIVAAEDVTVGKPDPQGYLLTIKLLSEQTGRPIAPADALVIEDAPSVITSVRAAGFRVLGVATTYSPDKLSEAHYVVDSLHPDVVRKHVPKLRMTVGAAR